jgi:hypothetical protein
MRLWRKEPEGKCAQGELSVCYPTLNHPNDEDLSLGTPKPQKQRRGKCGGIQSSQKDQGRCRHRERPWRSIRKRDYLALESILIPAWVRMPLASAEN